MRRLIVWAGVAAFAASTAAHARDRVTAMIAADAMPAAGVRLLPAPDSDSVLAIFDGGAWLWNSATLQVEKRFDATSTVEVLPSGHGLREVPVALLKEPGGKTQRVVIALTGEEVATLASDDTLMMVTRTAHGWVAISHNGRIETEAGDAGTKPRQLTVRLQGKVGPLKIIDLPPDPPKTRSPDIAISADGRLFAVAWKNEVRVLDLTAGTERTISGVDAGKAIRALAFTPNNRRLILMTETGPLLTADVATMTVAGTIAVPDLGRRFQIISRADGRVLEIEGRRQRAFVDTTTGKSVLAQRMSSGSGYLIRWVGKDLVLRGARGRLAPQTQYGVYRHTHGDFKMLYKHERARMGLGTLAASPNGACLFLAAPDGAAFNDLLTDKPIRAVDGLSKPLDQAAFTHDGRRVAGVDEAGALVTIAAPQACHGTGRE